MNKTIHQPQIAYLGVDLAKNVFHVCGMTRSGRVMLEKRFTRTQLERFTEQLPPCRIGLEACGSAHHWARLLIGQGHDARLIPPSFVKPYLKSNKNDARDAEAICEAASRPNMRFVPLRSEASQAVQLLHRMRERIVNSRTRTITQLRAMLSEFGVVIPQGANRFRKRVPEILEDGENGLLPDVRGLLADGYAEVLGLDAREQQYRKRIEAHVASDERCRRLKTIPGFGDLCASALVAKFGNGEGFRRGRDMSACLGLVPQQSSTGGKPKLGPISKRGDVYLRTLVVQGAQAVLRFAGDKADVRSRWACGIQQRNHRNAAAVALTNKNIRIAWALLRHGGIYREEDSMA